MFQTGNDVPASDLVRGAHDRSVLTTAMEIEGSDRWDQAKWDRLRRDLVSRSFDRDRRFQ